MRLCYITCPQKRAFKPLSNRAQFIWPQRGRNGYRFGGVTAAILGDVITSVFGQKDYLEV